jgi:(1->4)-alpha-D-glucan 1-alpha-D-glucosylmutase
MIDRALLERLSRAYGIEPEYPDIWGELRRVPAATLLRFLGAMGVSVTEPAQIEEHLAERERLSWQRLLPPVQVAWLDEVPISIELCMSADQASRRCTWCLTEEGGARHREGMQPAQLTELERRDLAGEAWARFRFTLPRALCAGYHRFELELQAQDGEPRRAAMSLIVAPRSCYRPQVVAAEKRVWGLAVQLYAVRSERNWGIGDFTDLVRMLELAAESGAGVVGVSPLHALFAHDPEHASPYSSSSRVFLNTLFVDVEAVADFSECAAARELVRSASFQARLRALRAAELVHYSQVAAAKRQVLEILYRHFREHHLEPGGERGGDFRRFQAEEGDALRQHALFQALQEHFHREDSEIWGWPVWAEAYRTPDSEAVRTFAEAHLERIELYEYLQWQAELQLATAGRRSFELGLGVGIYQDLAVAVGVGGAEVWARHDAYALEARIGSPPDDFNLEGQDWGLPPLNPERLRALAYQPFIATLRHNMRHAGALRIDHVMALFRLFWVPAQGLPRDGGYVHYPFEDLLGILALESQRNGCLVIGEDLGTVPPQVREALGPLGVLSCRLFYFEKDEAGHFKRPQEYPRQAVVAATAHDLPTLAGYWRGTDLELRTRLALFPSEEQRQHQVIARAADRARVLLALEHEALLPAGSSVDSIGIPEMTPELVRAIHVYLARSPGQLLVVQMEDALGQVGQVNLPGTSDQQHPNWRLRLSLDIEQWQQDPSIMALWDAIRAERGASLLPPPREQPEGRQAPQAQIPRATYRLQFHRDFRFDDARRIVGYLDALGISHCYASPILKARPGSAHGYDIIDHTSLNPELGGQADFDRLAGSLHQRGMGLLLDMVPNHMGVMGSDNKWWLDVLENGPASSYAHFFDIDWALQKDELRGKVLLPVLGDHYGNVLDNGELRLVLDAGRGELSVLYYEHRFPIDPREYPQFLGHRQERLLERLGGDHPHLLELQSLLTALANLPARNAGSEITAERNRDKEIHKQHFARLLDDDADIAWYIEENLAVFNGGRDHPEGRELLHKLIEAQAYRLSYWRVASDEINYRRFFDINELASLRMENEEVFAATHGKVLELIADGKVQGLRIDHPDGLYAPAQYFERLQEAVVTACCLGDSGAPWDDDRLPFYVLVEKILAPYERLPESWRVHGTTGYDFTNVCNGLFVDTSAEKTLEKCYSDFVRERVQLDELLYESKNLIMRVALSSELTVLANLLSRIAESDRHTCDFTLNGLREALREVVACMPVYRTYVGGEAPTSDDIRYIDWALALARKRSRAADLQIFDFLREVLLTRIAEGKAQAYRQLVVSFAMKFQQYTAPVMAKGLEDTAFYSYNRLVSLNEVGGDPKRFGLTVGAFHRANQERARRWPHSMLSSSTHDSKRSEDVRARINVLSELGEDWRGHLRRWRVLNRRKKRNLEGQLAPSANDEYLLYQTLIGAWPLEPMDGPAHEIFVERIVAYMLKAIKEAKIHSSWINPDTDYEGAVTVFVRELIGNPERSPFLSDFLPFQARVARLGMYNSLSQVLLKLAAPGAPDFYQGNELWDFSLVDPDNRRAVDFAHRQQMLEELQALDRLPKEAYTVAVRNLFENWIDGRVKLYVIWRVLGLRRREPSLFRDGDYLPVNAVGSRSEHICSFARMHADRWVLVVAPRLFAGVSDAQDDGPLPGSVWSDTWLELPAEFPERGIHNLLTAEPCSIHAREGIASLYMPELLAHFPVALLVGGEGDSSASP